MEIGVNGSNFKDTETIRKLWFEDIWNSVEDFGFRSRALQDEELMMASFSGMVEKSIFQVKAPPQDEFSHGNATFRMETMHFCM